MLVTILKKLSPHLIPKSIRATYQKSISTIKMFLLFLKKENPLKKYFLGLSKMKTAI